MVCEQNLIKDINLDKIVNYLKDYLNTQNTFTSDVIVNSVRNYDAFNVPIHDFPLLKIYRLKSNYLSSNKRKTDCEIQYGLVLPNQEKIVPYLNWVDYTINKALSQQEIWTLNIFIERSEKSCNYKTLMNEMGFPIYSFLRFNFTLIEGTI